LSNGEKYSVSSKSDNESWQLANIIYPLCEMYERCSGYEYIDDKSKIKSKLNLDAVMFYPENYDLNHIRSFDYSDVIFETKLFNYISGFKANSTAKNYCKLFINSDKKIITITLRSENFASAQNKKNFNSNIQEWIKVSQYLLDKNFDVMIIPDTFSEVPSEFKKIGCKSNTKFLSKRY
jgi:hypothetical protein